MLESSKKPGALLPAFGATVGISLAASLLWRGESAFPAGIILFALCCVLMGASCFGNEFQHRTLPLLLAQPLSRLRIWREKMIVLSSAVLLALAAYGLCLWLFTDPRSFDQDASSRALLLVFLALGVICTAPLQTLMTRNTLIGAVNVFCFPIAICLGLAFLNWLFNFESFLVRYPHLLSLYQGNPFVRVAVQSVIPLLYFVLSYFSGRARFLAYQAADLPAPEIALPARLERLLVWPFRRLIPGYTGPVASLIRKELHLQRPGYLIAGLVCLVSPLEALILKLHPSEVPAALLAVNFFFCIAIIPLVATGLSVAEERALGAAAWQQVLPPSIPKQWTVKLAVTLATCFLLGVLLPGLGYVVGQFLFSTKPFEFPGLAAWDLLFWILGWLLFLSLGVFASSVSTASFKAMLLHFGLIFAVAPAVVGNCWLFVKLTDSVIEHPPMLGRRLDLLHEAASQGSLMLLGYPALALALALAFINGLSYRNYKNTAPTTGRAWIQCGLLLLGVIGLTTGFWVFVTLFLLIGWRY